MEEAARHDLAARLTEQKVRESRVSRTQDEEGDEALRRPLREQEEKLRALTARQEELDKRTGGEFRLQTLEALRTDARRGLELSLIHIWIDAGNCSGSSAGRGRAGYWS